MKLITSQRSSRELSAIPDFKVLGITEEGDVMTIDDATAGEPCVPVIMIAVPGQMSRPAVARLLHLLADDIGADGLTH